MLDKKILLSVMLVTFFVQSSSLFAAGIPKTVVACTSSQCPGMPAILDGNEKLTDQAVVFQTSDAPEFMKRYEKNFADRDNGGWQHIEVNESTFINTQPVIGFGGAFTDTAAMLYSQMSPALQKEFTNAYFATQGIAYSLGRVPMASNDFSCRKELDGKPVPSQDNCSNVFSLYSYAEDADDTLSHFALQSEDIDFKIPMIKAAFNAAQNNTIRLFASPWSAPAWMKTNGNMVHGSLNPDYQQAWATYFVKFLQAYKHNDITFWGLTVQNEPEETVIAGQSDLQTWQTMYLTKEQEADFVKNYLGPALKQYEHEGGNKIQLMIHDDQVSTINQRADLANDTQLAQYVSGAGLHWYMNNDSNYANLDSAYQRLNADKQERFILGTEACEGYFPLFPGPSLGNWSRGEAYGHDIISGLNHHVSGWTDWNLVLNMQGGATWAKNYLDAPILFDAAKQTFYKQPMYYYLGHFSKFIRPASRLLASRSSGPFPLEEVTFKVAAYQNLPETIVIVVMNRDMTGRTYYIKDNSISAGNKYLNMTIPAHAIQTIIYKSQEKL